MTEQDNMESELIEAGMAFYLQAESPNEYQMRRLFAALVRKDFGELEDLFETFGIDFSWET